MVDAGIIGQRHAHSDVGALIGDTSDIADACVAIPINRIAAHEGDSCRGFDGLHAQTAVNAEVVVHPVAQQAGQSVRVKISLRPCGVVAGPCGIIDVSAKGLVIDDRIGQLVVDVCLIGGAKLHVAFCGIA